jgi:hypothetical protein
MIVPDQFNPWWQTFRAAWLGGMWGGSTTAHTTHEPDRQDLTPFQTAVLG